MKMKRVLKTTSCNFPVAPDNRGFSLMHFFSFYLSHIAKKEICLMNEAVEGKTFEA